MTHPITPAEAIQVNTSISGNQSSPKMLLLSDGRLLYVWTDNAAWDDVPSMTLQARIYNADGTPATGQISLTALGAVDGFDGYDWDNLDVDLMQDGSVLISWVRGTVETGKDAPVFAILQATDSDLIVTTPRTAIQSNDTTIFESPPVTTVLDDGRVLFVWSKKANWDDVPTMTLQGRIYDPASGSFTSGEFQIGNVAVDGTDWADVPNLNITQLAGGNIVVTWSRSNVEAGFNEPVYTVLDPTGATVRATSEIEGSDTEIQHTPWESPAQIVALSDGRWMATWVNDGYSDDLRTMTIEARIFNADGTPATGDIRVGNTAVDGSDLFDNSNFSIIEIGGGRVVIGYVENFVTSGDHSTLPHFTILDAATGATVIADVQIPVASLHPWAGPPVIEALGDSGYFVAVYADGDQFSGGATGLSYRIFDGDGQAVTGDVRLTSATAASALSGIDAFDWDQVDVVFNPTNGSFTVGWVGQSDGNGTAVYTSGPVDVSALTGGGVTPDGIVNGTGGNDVMLPDFVDAQGDVMDGADGLDDVVLGGAGNDRIEAGLGNDSVDGEGGDDSIDGGAGDDAVTGGDGDDSLSGSEGDDTLSGGAGEDLLDGGDGRDTLLGGLGADSLTGGDGDDALQGEEGDDSLVGEDGSDFLEGGAGDDLLSGGAGDDSLDGASGDDRVFGGDGADLLLLGEGDDLAFAEEGDDVVFAAEGNDTITGGDGADFVSGGSGDDVIDTGGSLALPDVLFLDLGEADADQNDDRDIVFGDAGNDRIVTGDDGDEAYGGEGDDLIDSGLDADFVFGGSGNDTLVAGEGGDEVDGGDGDDLIYGGVAPGDLDLFSRTDDLDLAPENDLDSISGGAGNDTIFGGDDADLLAGDEGDDWLDGGIDADTLIGGLGQDTLTGGEGADVFVFVQGGDLTITDFEAGDMLTLTAYFTDLTELVEDFNDDGIINQSFGDFADNQAMQGSITLTGVSDLVLTTDTTGLL